MGKAGGHGKFMQKLNLNQTEFEKIEVGLPSLNNSMELFND